MSTQEDAGIPISSAPDGRGYRLLELPPELETLLDSRSAPVVYLRQPDTSTSAILAVDGGSEYALQQKNTSNALVLLEASSSSSSSDDPAAPAGMTAVSTLHETIELVVRPVNAEQKSRGKWHEKFGKRR